MPIVKRVAKVAAGGGGRQAVARSPAGVKLVMPQVTLSSTRTSDLALLETQSIWLYGLPGVGKTTLASQFASPHIFSTDGGAKFAGVPWKPVNSWLEYVAYIDAFLESDFKFAVVDVLDYLFDMCFTFMCEQVLLIEHPNDEKDFGKSWGAIYTEFMRQQQRLIRSGRGVIFISHAAERLYKPAMEAPYEIVRPTINSKICERLEGQIDMLCYIGYDVELQQLAMTIRPNGTVLAKTRPTKNFLYPDGSPVETFPLGRSPESAFKAYVDAFNNRLAKPQPKADKPSLGLRLKKAAK